MIKLRTHESSEWEIRYVFNEVADILCNKFPLMMYGLKKEMVDGQYQYVDEKKNG
jgi:hypothetical protein